MKAILAILILNLISKEGSCVLNPCPRIIQFHTNETELYGIVTIPPTLKSGINILKVKVGLHDDPTGGTNSLQFVKSVDEVKADIGRGNNVQFKLNFLQSDAEEPNIVKITLNNKDICTGITIKASLEFEIQSVFLLPNLPTPPPTTASPQPFSEDTCSVSWLQSLTFAGTCGRTFQPPSETITWADFVAPGEYPWMVAVYHYIPEPEGSMRYVCTASLISDRHVITAAHCVRNQTEVHLDFGRNNIDNYYEKFYFSRTSWKIITHPEYKVSAYGDIALVSFYPPIQFTQWVVPICLWGNFDSKLHQGTVTGWGPQNQERSRNIIPMQLSIPMVGLEMCKQLGSEKLTVNKTFCAGEKGARPCKTDSGGGFFVMHENIWYLRGIISQGNAWTCNNDEYSEYTDLTYALDWIRPYLTQDPVGPSIAKQKCEEYKKLRSNTSLSLPEGHIVTSVSQYPHVAFLGYFTERECTGVLISDQFILTTANCLRDNRADVSIAHLGFLDKSNRNETGTLQEFKIIKTYVHPTRKLPRNYGDIALLKLDRPVVYTQAVLPVCLQEDFNIPTDNVQEIGWGWQVDAPDSDVLQVTNLTLSYDADCASAYDVNQRHPKGVDHLSQFCATIKERTCDPKFRWIRFGKPLQIRNSSGIPTVVGILSSDLRCQSAQLYSRVSYYIHWIESIVWPEKKENDEMELS